HRRRVTREILRSGRGGRLTVFGAGNCNDLDLTRLAGAFAEVHLLDLDEDAMDAGVRRQGLRSNGKVHLHGGLDFSGLAYALDRPLANADSFARSLREGVGKNLAGGPPPADVVVSTCVLSQLIDSVARTAAHDEEARERAVIVRDHHLDTLFERTAP